MTDRTELRRLLDAKKGPWEPYLPNPKYARYEITDARGYEVAYTVDDPQGDCAQLIAAAVNALPALLDAAAERDRLAGLLDEPRRSGCAVEIAGVRIAPCDERGQTADMCALVAAADRLAHMREARDNSRAEVERLTDERDALAAAVARVRALHRPVGIYDECECSDEAKAEGHEDVEDIGLTCNRIYTVCAECCRDDVYQTEDCASYHDHKPDEAHHCPTIRALGGEQSC